MGKHPYKRKIKNYLINPDFQLKFVVYFIVSGVAVVGGMMAFIIRTMTHLRQELLRQKYTSEGLRALLNETTTEMIFIMGLTLVIFAGVAFVYSVIISHRIAGPVVAINAFINDLKKGNYESQRRLRDYDDLKSIMDNLYELAESLKGKK